jgi:hypothetical protein
MIVDGAGLTGWDGSVIRVSVQIVESSSGCDPNDRRDMNFAVAIQRLWWIWIFGRVRGDGRGWVRRLGEPLGDGVRGRR